MTVKIYLYNYIIHPKTTFINGLSYFNIIFVTIYKNIVKLPKKLSVSHTIFGIIKK